MLPVCVIVGAGPGIGQATARKFLDRNYHVALLARNSEKLDAMAAALGQENVSTWSVDVSDTEQLTASLADLASRHGHPDVVLYNAFSLTPGRGSLLKKDNLEQSFKVNVSSAMAVTQLVLPEMKKNGRGTVLFTGGGFALCPEAKLTALSIGKAGLRTLAFCLHDELKPLGIHVGTVTVCGIVKPDTAFDPEKIANAFLELHDQPKESFAAEVVFDGK